MSAVTITDALARHFLERVAGTKGAYATGAGAQGAIGALPQDVFDTPIVIAYWQHVETLPGSFERTTWTIRADAFFAAVDAAAAYAAYVGYVDALRTSIRGNWTLFGTCTQIQRWEGGDPLDETINKKPYVLLPFTFTVLEAGPVTYALQ